MTTEIPQLILIGAGGHAKMLIEALQMAREGRSLALLDSNPARHGTSLMGVPIIGDDGMLERLAHGGTREFAVAVGGVRDNGPRARLFELAASLGLKPLTIAHPRSMVSAWAFVGDGCQMLPGAIVNVGARLGRNVIVNTAAVVEHDCTLGDHVHIATGARLASTVTVGAKAHIGAGAVVRQSIAVGMGAVVGAGAVVVKDVADFAVVAGVPAKELAR